MGKLHNIVSGTHYSDYNWKDKLMYVSVQTHIKLKQKLPYSLIAEIKKRNTGKQSSHKQEIVPPTCFALPGRSRPPEREKPAIHMLIIAILGK